LLTKLDIEVQAYQLHCLLQNVMKAPESHKEFSKRRDYPLAVFAKERFCEWEILILSKHGYWLEALSNGAILPCTPEQEQFLKVCTGQADAVTPFEKAWWKLVQRRKFEAMPSLDPGYIAGTAREIAFGHYGD
jgi:uncharacterized protein YifE (UPF0438 family)